jgi:hypothetical protein
MQLMNLLRVLRFSDSSALVLFASTATSEHFPCMPLPVRMVSRVIFLAESCLLKPSEFCFANVVVSNDP